MRLASVSGLVNAFLTNEGGKETQPLGKEGIHHMQLWKRALCDVIKDTVMRILRSLKPPHGIVTAFCPFLTLWKVQSECFCCLAAKHALSLRPLDCGCFVTPGCFTGMRDENGRIMGVNTGQNASCQTPSKLGQVTA